MKRVVAALGGNAFAPAGAPASVEDESERMRGACECLGPFFQAGTELLVTHGNGPQVGHQLLRVERSLGEAYPVPLDVCVAQTQGELGYLLVRAIDGVLARRGLSRPLAALVTQVVVDPGEVAFSRPTKPIGPVLLPDRAASLRRAGVAVVDEPGRGPRRVVASPEPRSVVELEVIRQLLSLGAIVVAGGGGGVPVVPGTVGYRGVEAVVDKDLTAALLADALDAALLLLVTDVPCAYASFATPAQQPIPRLTAARARELLGQRWFGEGSMAPKIEAAARFTQRPGRRAIICDLRGVARALAGEGGTTVVPT